MLEGIAERRALNAVSRDGLVKRWLMALVVLVAEELGKLDGGSRAIAENDVGRVDVGVRWMSRGRRDFRRRACRLGRRSQFQPADPVELPRWLAR